MRKPLLVGLLLAVFAAAPKCWGDLPRDAKMYIQSFEQFDTYLGAAFSKKHIPVVIVSSGDQADLKLTILNDGQRITGVRVESKDKEILWTYVFPKPVKSEQKAADKCAAEMRHQFPPSPEEIARREQRQENARAAMQQWAQQPVTICNGNYVVRPGTYLTFPFQITGPVTAQGNFEVAGGAGNDIQVVIGPRAEVLNWLNGHGGAVNYASEKLTSGNVSVPLTESGDYLIAFSNTFSLVSAKTVAANFQVAASASSE